MADDYVALVIGYQRPDLVSDVLEQLAEQTLPPKRVIVVDNGGTFTETGRKRWPLAKKTTLISRPDNPGYGAAVNLAREHLTEDALLVLTHDARFDKDLASSLLAELSKAEAVGAAGPLLHFVSTPERLFSAGGSLSTNGAASHLRTVRDKQPYPVDWLDGAIVMYRVKALDSIDWLDEGYFLYFEDVDTGWRLGQAGWQNVLVPGTLAYQQPGAHPVYLGMRNMALFARKAEISRGRSLIATLPRAFRVALSNLRHGKNPQLAAAFRGLRDGYAGKSGPV